MSRQIKVQDKVIGDGCPCFIIAEAGSNHDGSLEQAKQLIDIAAEAKVDAVKFQLFTAKGLYSEKAPAYPIIQANELPRTWLPELVRYSREKNVMFLATPFDREAVDALEEIDVPLYKWASLEIVDLPLLNYTASKGKPVIVSTGVSDLGDIQDAINAIYAAGNKDVILLHCSSLFEYPQKPSQVNLRMIDTMRNAFHVPAGFSDHTVSIAIPAAAVARGSCVIEKHFTISRQGKGPDHFFALEPRELADMVSAIREVEASLGSSVKQRIAEEDRAVAQRPSLIAKDDIRKGQRITEDMLLIKRPGYGIQPKLLHVVVGREAREDIKQGDGITWDVV